MKDFPEFMKRRANLVPASQQNTDDVEGYFFEGADGSQMAFWTCHAARVSKKHAHPFDEYTVCVSGQYTAHVGDATYILNPGDELHVSSGTEQWGECLAGTRTIHCFGGRRVKR